MVLFGFVLFQTGRQLPTPTARLLGRPPVETADGLVTGVLHAATDPAPRRTRQPDRYEVIVRGLNALREQSVRGNITITRNENLISEKLTRKPFVLHIPNVRPDHAAIPKILQTREIVIPKLAGRSLAFRIERFLEELLFPEPDDREQRKQVASVVMAYARPIVQEHEAEDAVLEATPEPADTRTMFVPIAITPAIGQTHRFAAC